jgi:hypothetical protein
MRDAPGRPNSVTALRSRDRSAGSFRVRRVTVRALVVAAVIAAGAVALLTDRHLRGWAATIAVASLLGAAIAWLAGTSYSLSASGRDPQDFPTHPTS